MGLVDWEAIEDRTRNLRALPTWASPADIIATAAEEFRLDLWKVQRFRPEVWVEKDALVGIMQVACDPLRVPYFACRGYVSDSEVWGAARRLREHAKNGQRPVVLHLGDHDPSGVDMTRDIEARLTLFAEFEVPVVRLALNRPQIDKYRPPPNPAKSTDARFRAYRRKHGSQSWELDALEPEVLVELVQSNVQKLLIQSAWDAAVREEEERRSHLRAVAEGWDDRAFVAYRKARFSAGQDPKNGQ